MKTEEQSFSSFVHVLKQRARPACWPRRAVLLGMTVVRLLVASGVRVVRHLLIQQSEITPEMLGGEATKEYVEQRLQKTRELVMNAENGRSAHQEIQSLRRTRGRQALRRRQALAVERERPDPPAGHRRRGSTVHARRRPDLCVRRRVPAWRPDRRPRRGGRHCRPVHVRGRLARQGRRGANEQVPADGVGTTRRRTA